MARKNKLFSGLSVKKSFIRLDLGFYWFWAILRIVLTLWPQTGYIHPDEFFQTVEIFAGNVFDIEVSVPWEFNTTYPIRSIVLTCTFIQLPMHILKLVSEFVQLFFGISILTSYVVLVLPRLSMCLISFISDYCLYRICYLYGQNYKERLIIFASSYVSLVYMTRTFNNNVEVLCFNLLLYLVASCMAESEKINYQNSYLKSKHDTATTIADRVRINKLMKLLPKHSLSRCLTISFVTVAGVFNRPTFICYAAAPLFYWIQRGMGSRSTTFLKDFHSRVLLLAIYALPCVCLFIFADSSYYGYITWGEIINKKIDTNNFVVTPLNFLKYNLNQDNLSKHGLHPRFLHIFINIPLLFNVLGVSALIVIFKLVYRGTHFSWTLLPKPQSITGLMTLSFIVPVVSLSVIPHQEPRFIMPVLLPLVFLYSHMVKDFEEHCTSVVPFRKRYPQKSGECLGILNIPMKCISYVSRITENFDNRYNVYGRFLSSIKSAEQERKVFEQKEKCRRMNDDSNSEEEDDDGYEEVQDKKEEEIKKVSRSSYLLVLWYIFNVFSVIFFGFVHQGGIYPLTKHFSNDIEYPYQWKNIHLVTSHSYSLPVHLLLLKSTKRQRYSVDGKKFQLSNNFFLYEHGTQSIDRIYLKIDSLLRVSEARRRNKIDYELYYALPASKFNNFKNVVGNASDFSFTVVDTFFPHLSMEALPQLKLDHSLGNKNSIWNMLAEVEPLNIIANFFLQLKIVLIQIKPRLYVM